MKLLRSRISPKSAGGVRLMAPPDVHKSFWFECQNELRVAARDYITEVDLTELEGSTRLECTYWPPFPLVKTVDLQPVKDVVTSRCLLHRMTGLEAVDLTPLANLKRDEGGFFLSNCMSLKHVDTRPLVSIDCVGRSFAADCLGLDYIDLGGLRNVKTIHSQFLARCASLKQVDFSALENVTYIHKSFMTGCSRLDSIDLSPLKGVRNVEQEGFLSSCPNLHSFDPSVMTGLTSHQQLGLFNGTSITAVNLEPYAALTTLPPYFMKGCSSLKSIDLSPLSNITSIPVGFLSGCTSLKHINLSPLKKVKSIHTGFMRDCVLVREIDFSGMECLEEVSVWFMDDCDVILTPIYSDHEDEQDVEKGHTVTKYGKRIVGPDFVTKSICPLFDRNDYDLNLYSASVNYAV